VESGDIAPMTFKKGDNGGGDFFHNSIIGNFMVYQVKVELKQFFSIVHFINFEVNSVVEQ